MTNCHSLPVTFSLDRQNNETAFPPVSVEIWPLTSGNFKRNVSPTIRSTELTPGRRYTAPCLNVEKTVPLDKGTVLDGPGPPTSMEGRTSKLNDREGRSPSDGEAMLKVALERFENHYT